MADSGHRWLISRVAPLWQHAVRLHALAMALRTECPRVAAAGLVAFVAMEGQWASRDHAKAGGLPKAALQLVRQQLNDAKEPMDDDLGAAFRATAMVELAAYT